MPCTITDYWRYNAADGTAVAIVGAEILAVPDLNTRRYQIGGTGAYQSLATNPLITSAAYRYGRRTETSAGGQYSLVLPQSGESKPSTPAAKWSIVLPDGKVLSGTVPAVSGPLTLDDLETTHGWTWNSAVAVAPTSGTLARGTAPFSAQEYFDVVFGADFASAAALDTMASFGMLSCAETREPSSGCGGASRLASSGSMSQRSCGGRSAPSSGAVSSSSFPSTM